MTFYPIWAPGAVFDYTKGRTGAYAAAAVSRKLWNGGLGSSSSYYNYGTNGGCVDQSDYATDSVLSGHHVRYWMSAVGTRPAGAAHHDFLCGFGHSADQFTDSAIQVAAYLSGLYSGRYPAWYVIYDRAPSSFNKCGEVVPDDGVTHEMDFTRVAKFDWVGP